MKAPTWIAAALAVLGTAMPGSAQDEKGVEFFEKKIRPVLVSECYGCHSARAKKIKGALLLDTRAGLIKGGNMGAAIIPGNLEGSLLLQAIKHADPDIEMPPKKRLPDEVVADFEAWIRMGAPDPREGTSTAGPVPIAAKDLWSFQPVVDPGPARDVDRFIREKLKAEGLDLAPPADRTTLIRRATFDLVGLPPTPEEVDAFLADTKPGAFARVVDRLLASEHYGERWGRHWMDLVRYADTSGDGADWPIPEARHYRDYIIDSFNADLPYDTFLVEQLAGDILARANPKEPRFEERIIATGFIAMSRRFNNGKYRDMHLVIENTIDTIGKAFLGMSLGCARCHDHKFDPVTKEDYYGFYGYFASTQYPHAGTEHGRGHDNLVPLTPDPEKFAAARKYVNDWYTEYNGWRKERRKGAEQRFKKLYENPPDVRFAWAVIDADETGDEKVQLMGNPDREGERVPRGYLSSITAKAPKIGSGESGRLSLARWIASADNPLSARVMANRVWQHHFGRGIVPTSSTFGKQGRPPTHPELLDWLAARFVEDGWSIKKLHRRIMLSDAYRASGKATPGQAAKDPANRLFGRFERRRLDADAIRDAILAVAGTLDRSRPGRHPFPEEIKMNWTQHSPFTSDYDHRHRSVYLMTRRLGKHPFMNLFDGPDANVCVGRRKVSTVPLQALFMMNSPFVRGASEGFAKRILEEPEGRVDRAYRLAFGRPPTGAERNEAREYLQAYASGMERNQVKGDPEARSWASFCRILFSSSEFIYVD